ncbi:endo-1,4-beta-xylanase [Pseudolysinimonas sp.]|jgi:GH35 family endo-1,4-beta-xylanase|uniref:endo-1,4-beta-xylanase n=1 Tax=Pseudolysinimonas sp. TaxID=2680009 RepID=UPI00378383FE
MKRTTSTFAFIATFALIFALPAPASAAQGNAEISVEADWLDVIGREVDTDVEPTFTDGYRIGSTTAPAGARVAFSAEEVVGFDLVRIYVDGRYTDEIDFTADAGESYDIRFVYQEPYDGEIPALKDVFPELNMGAGGVSRSYFTPGSRLNDLLRKHFTTITAGNDMKPDAFLGRTPTIGADGRPVLNFTIADQYADYAQENGVALHGHTLVWHSQTPGWFFREGYSATAPRVSRAVMLDRMEWYIKSIVTHYDSEYPGVIYAWDVVNEAAGENNRGMRGQSGQGTSDWYTVVGPDFVAKAFEYARRYAAPGVKLLYNDYGINGHEKRQSALEFLLPIKDAGNIDGIGEQAHHHINNSVTGDEETYRTFAELFGYLEITELDALNTAQSTGGDVQQATWYHDYFASLTAMKAEGIDLGRVIMWGIGDSDSWKRADLPLLFELGTYNPKPAFWAITGVEGDGAKNEVKTAVAFAGTPDGSGSWAGQNTYPIGRLGTYQVTYDAANAYFRIGGAAGAWVEMSLAGHTHSGVIGADGTLDLTVPISGLAGSAAFDIGIVDGDAFDAWNSYFYTGRNLGESAYQGRLQLGSGESRAISFAGTLNEGAVNPTLEISVADPRFNFQTRTEGPILGTTEVLNSNMVLGLGWNVDEGTTGLEWEGITTAGGKTLLRFSGTARAGTVSISANASSFGQRAQGIAMSNTLEVAVFVPLVNRVAPAISGTAVTGATLTADAGEWSVADAEFAYQWLRDGDPAGASSTSTTYQVTDADFGRRLSVRVTATVDGQEPVTATSAAVAVSDRATAAPGRAVLSHDNGWDTGLQDGSYNVVMNLWWGQTGSALRLFENGTLVATIPLSYAGTGAQSVSVPVSGRANGTYVYTGELVNGKGSTATGSTTVKVTQANPGQPVLSADNWDGDGAYTVTANMWWGMNATSYTIAENGVVIAQGELGAATPAAQVAKLPVTGKPIGSYVYVVEFANTAGATSSNPITVTVTR